MFATTFGLELLEVPAGHPAMLAVRGVLGGGAVSRHSNVAAVRSSSPCASKALRNIAELDRFGHIV